MERVLPVNIKEVFGEGCSFPNCKDGTFYLDLSHLVDPTKSSSYISKCMTMAGKDKRFVIYRKISELLYRLTSKDTIIFSGSKSDGSNIPGSDSDLLLILEFKVLMDRGKIINAINLDSSGTEYLLADLSSISPGFTKLTSLSCEKYFTYDYLSLIKMFPEFIKAIQVGPSIQASSEEGKILGDLVPAIPCSDWPHSNRQRWIHRPRPFGWPPKHVVEDLSKTDCFVVPVGREDSEESHLEWRFAFPFVELGLVWAFNTIQLQCFVLLKVLNNVFLKKIDNVSDGISSFHIKTVMFWECEKSQPEDWSEEKLFECVRRCLCSLRLAIQEKELKHYIIEERNVLFTKLKNPETREKVIKKIQNIENDISGSIIDSILERENVDLVFQMINFQHTSQNASTSLGLDFNNRLAWANQVNLVTTTLEMMGLLNMMALKMLFKTSTSKKIDIIDVLRGIKNDINIKYIPDFMKDIHLIVSDRICNEAIEQNLLQVGRILTAIIDIQIGSKLFDEATKTKGVQKKKMLLDAERNFKKGVELDNIAGHIYLVTFYLACGNDESAENVLVSLLTQNGVFVCFDTFTNDAISISDGNIKLTSSVSHNFRQRGYASSFVFDYNDLELVPDVLKYDLCVGLKIMHLHPFFYAKYLQIHFSIKSKSRFVTQYIEELRQSPMTWHLPLTPAAPDSKNFNILAYCFRQIGATNEAIYYYMLSRRNTPDPYNSAMFHLAFLLNQIKKKNSKALNKS